MAVTDFSTVAANNNSAPPAGAPEGMAASAVNDTMRAMMASIAVEAQVNAVKVLNTVAGTNTITASMTPALTAYSAGMLVVFTPANSNTGATTININSLGALDVQKAAGSALVSGDLVAGVPALLLLDSGADDFILLNPQSVVSAVSVTSLTNSGQEFHTGVISPPALSAGNNNDYAPTGFATAGVLRVDGSAGSTITGIAGGAAGRYIQLYNIGSALLLFAAESASSSAANRFAMASQAAVNPGLGIGLWYDGVSSRWRILF